VSRAGMPEQYVELDVRRLRALPEQAGYLSVLIVQAGDCGAATLPLQQREEEV
jgi:hypothetical protein